MRVRMTTHIGGTRNGEEWPAIGGVIDLPDHEATDLISAGYAVPDDGSVPAEEAPDADEADPAPEPDDGEAASPEADAEAVADPEPVVDEPQPAKRAAKKS